MTKNRLVSIGVVALVAVIVAAYFAIGADAGFAPPPSGVSTKWPKNASGVTYGSSGTAVSLEDEPELIAIEATNGKRGYSYKTDLDEPMPTSPAAAVARQKAKALAGYKPEFIPVYKVDGLTQIGVFIRNSPGTVKLN